jgi:hypothetical protein
VVTTAQTILSSDRREPKQSSRNHALVRLVALQVSEWRAAMENANMNHYVHLLIMAVLSFIAMYIFMYAMVDRFENVYPNLNQAYMAALMAAPMVMIELAVMRSMYKNRVANIAILAASVLLLVVAWFFIRQQTFIGNSEFIKSMIPHHAGAILMCEQASIQDDELKKLCKEITSSQQAEIDQMKAILKRLGSR